MFSVLKKRSCILCISGKAGHGKDTSANYIKNSLEKLGNRVLITHYGDLVKYVCKNFFNWDGKKDLTGRTLLQHIGTDIIRKEEPSYWVNFIIGIIKFFPNEWDYILIPDCRFPDEYEMLIENNMLAYLLRIERTGFMNSLTETQRNHISETALDDYPNDFVIYNDSGLEELELKCEIFSKVLEEIKESEESEKSEENKENKENEESEEAEGHIF